MAFTPRMEKEKIHRIIADLSEMIYVFSRPVEDVCIAHGECPTVAAGKVLDYCPFEGGLAHWGGTRDDIFTFRVRCVIPEELDGLPVCLRVSTGREGRWNALNPQFVVFCNGVLKQALDTNHTEILLSERAVAGDTYELFLEGWTGLAGGDCVMQIQMAGIRREVEGLFYDLKVGLEAALVLDEEDGHRVDELNALRKTCNLIDFRDPGSDAFYASVSAARDYCRREFYDRFAGNDATVHCIGHTHIDVAWQWRLVHTRRKACRSFSTVNELMDRFPDYLFSSSQAQLYDFVRQDYPELYEKIKARVAEGRFEPEGSMWVEADCNIPSGESFVRQIMHGKRFFREQFGRENHILWLPDVFGYSSSLPQILKKSGVDCFITSKISWNEYNRMPNDTFLWQGIDGTEVLTQFHTMSERRQPKDSFFASYNGFPAPECVARTWTAYKNKDVSRDVMASYGYGDGGGGPTAEMLEYATRLRKGLPGVPKVLLDTKDGFVRKLSQNFARAERKPRWVGELYMEMHRGTFTTQGANKRANRKSELAYQGCEFLSAFADKALGTDTYPREMLDKGWETILLNQFHDIIPGSSIHEVYEDSQSQYREILSRARTASDRAEQALAANATAAGEGVAVFNKNGHAIGGVVFADVPAKYHSVKDPAGRAYPIQRTSDGRAAFFAADVPPMGYKVFTFATEDLKAAPLTADEKGMTGRFARLRFDRAGNLSSIYDKKAHREVLPKGARGNRLLAFEDRPRQYDAWDITVYYDEKSYPVDELTSLRVKECGPVFATVEVVRPYMHSTIRQEITMYADHPRIDFHTFVDWHEVHTLLKCAFPVDVHANFADYDIQFGNVSRPTHGNTSWEQAKFEMVGHKWADLSQADFGMSLLNDCKYGHDIRDGVMRLSLLRSPTYPDETADQGAHEFTYAILPHAGGWREARTPDAAYALNDPLEAVPVTAGKRKLPEALSLVSCDAPHVMIDTVKLSEGGRDLIVRLYEYENREAKAKLTCALPVVSASDCDLLENDLSALPVRDGKVNFSCKPYEIKTLRLVLKD